MFIYFMFSDINISIEFFLLIIRIVCTKEDLRRLQ